MIPPAHAQFRETYFADATEIPQEPGHGVHQYETMRQSGHDQNWQAHMDHQRLAYLGQCQPYKRYCYSEPSIFVQPDHEQSAPAAAANAMEILSRLCSESEWQWVDGMLLAGCLAYGLGDFVRALKWYSKVLSCDPKYSVCPLL